MLRLSRNKQKTKNNEGTPFSRGALSKEKYEWNQNW